MDSFRLKPSYIMRRLRERLTDLRNQNYVISYPRSGRNWSRNMLTDCGVPSLKEKVFDLDTLPQEFTNQKKIIFGHDVADFPYIQRLHSSNPARDFRPERYRGKKIFLVVRSPIDIAISHFHWMGYNENKGESVGDYPKDINEFVTSEEFGVKKIAAFHGLWRQFLTQGNIVDSYVIYNYDDIKADAGKYLRTMFDFFGFDVPEDVIVRAVEKNSAETAKKDAARETPAGKKLSLHGPQKVSDEVMAQLRQIMADVPQDLYQSTRSSLAA